MRSLSSSRTPGWFPAGLGATTADDARFRRNSQKLVEEVYPDADKLVLVTDHLNIHHTACLYKRYSPAEARRIAMKIEWHYTPVHASWLNIAECELSVLKRQCLRSRTPDIATVVKKVAAWVHHRNSKHAGIDWRFTTEDALIKLKRLYPVVNIQESS